MDTKVCTKCLEPKSLDEFAKKGLCKDGRQKYDSHCKTCHRQFVNRHYEQNKDYYKDKSLRRARATRQWLREYKSTLVCEKCGQDHPAALDFHHDDPAEKDINLAYAVMQGWGKDRIMQEVAKCRVLCASCHRILHYEEKWGVGVTE